ncbi:MAG: mucoidy inhibitor MuiA family protein [Saprospiraceae bacterium]
MLTKKLYCLILVGILFPFSIFSQETEKEINASIEEVRIHLQGAEIIRTDQVTLPKGKHKLIFTGLSPMINQSSIQISTESDDVNILSTTSRINFLKEKKESNPAIVILQDSLILIADKMQNLADEEGAITQEKNLLEKNRQLSGKEKAVDFEQLKATAAFYRERFLAINKDFSKIRKERAKWQKEQRKIQQQLNEFNAGRRPTSEIYLALNCDRNVTTTLRVRYIVGNAGWSPIYDLTVKNLNEPINIKYRALAFNDTGIDWNDVKVVLSTADVNQSATLPILNPWFIKENLPQVYAINQGRFNNIQNSNVYIQEEKKAKDNSNYQYDNQIQLSPSTGNVRFEEIEISELSSDFEIDLPYTIPADRKPYSIIVNEAELPANYGHYSVPKMDKDAFLLGQVVGWEDLDLMPGPMNIYYDKSFIGMAQLDTRSLSDTLNLSLGRDSKVLVKRTKLKELTKKQFMQGKKKMTTAYRITVKNNRNRAIDFELLDQIPISKLKEIDVDVKDIAGAKYYENTGKLKWDFKLQPGESKTVEFSFSITYPKDKEIKIDKGRKVVTPRYY